MPPAKPLIDPATFDMLRAAESEGVPHAARALAAAEIAATDRPRTAAELAAIAPETDDLRILFLCFQFFFRTGDLDRALHAAEKRRTLASERALPAEAARACTNLGLIHLAAGRRAEAIARGQEACAIDESTNNIEGLARDLGNLANVYEDLREFPTATALNTRAIELARRCNAVYLVAGRLANLGDIALATGKPVEARDLWAQAVTLFTDIGQPALAHEYQGRLAALPPISDATPPR